MLIDSIAKNWWILAVRGTFAVIFGILAFVMPGITLATLVLVFGIYAIVDGVSAIMMGGSIGLPGQRWWQMILVGVISIIAGILTFAWPAITAVALLACIAAWAIVRGAMEIYAAVKLRNVISNEWLLILAGVCSILFGVIVIARPAVGALAVLWIIGSYAIIFGILTIALSLRIRSMKTFLNPAAGA